MSRAIPFLAILLVSSVASACDSTKAVAGLPGLGVTLHPGVPHIETWDFSDCGFGITSDSFYVTKPRTKNGFQNSLPNGTPISLTLHDLTTGEYYTQQDGGFSFYCINDCASVCGHVIELTITLSASAHKNLDVEITQVATWGGPCQ